MSHSYAEYKSVFKPVSHGPVVLGTGRFELHVNDENSLDVVCELRSDVVPEKYARILDTTFTGTASRSVTDRKNMLGSDGSKSKTPAATVLPPVLLNTTDGGSVPGVYNACTSAYVHVTFAEVLPAIPKLMFMVAPCENAKLKGLLTGTLNWYAYVPLLFVMFVNPYPSANTGS